MSEIPLQVGASSPACCTAPPAQAASTYDSKGEMTRGIVISIGHLIDWIGLELNGIPHKTVLRGPAPRQPRPPTDRERKSHPNE